MSWVFLDGTKYTTTASTVSMAFDGIFTWVLLSNNSLDVVGFFGGNDNTKENIDISSSITSVNNIVYGDGKIYVFSNTKIAVIDTQLRTVERTIDILLTTNCVPEYGNFKLWFTSSFSDNNTKQKIFYYDLTDSTWSTPIDIFGAHQDEPRKILWGLDDFVWITAYNETGILKYNADTGAYIAQVIVNRKPETLSVNDDKEVLVASFLGMISAVNQTTNVSTNITGNAVIPDSIIDDGTYIWTNKPSLNRIEKGIFTDNILEMTTGATLDYQIVGFSDTSFKQIFLTAPYAHQEWNGTSIVNIVEQVRVVLLANNAIYFAYNLTDSWDLEELRVYNHDVKVTAIVGTGPDKYFGETT